MIPLLALGHEVLRTTVMALVGFAILRWIGARWAVPGLRAALGASGTAQ